MVVHIHDGNSPAADTSAPHLPAPAPVFVDASGRRARLMRWAGVLLAAGTLVYVPIVGLAVLSGPPVDRSAPLLDEEFGLETGDQPGGPDVPRDPATVNDPAGSAVAPPDHSPHEATWPIPLPAPAPEHDDPAPAPPPVGPAGGSPPSTPSTVGPTGLSESPSPSGAAPSPSPRTPPPVLAPTARALLDLGRRYPTR